MGYRIVVVDDDAEVRDLIAAHLGTTHDVRLCAGSDEALQMMSEDPPDVLITDLVMPGEGGVGLVRRALARFPDLAVIAITGLGSVADFLDLFEVGIGEFVRKPFRRTDLEMAIVRAVATRRLRAENARLRSLVGCADDLPGLTGESAPIRRVKQEMRRFAATDALVLITGESGTGKELVARGIHDLSRRRPRPLVVVHCGALAESLLESELFGHARGAFTGALSARAGAFESAAGGTIFLDEIGTMPERAQVRLLRVLQERRIVRVGESVERPVDVRIIAATNVDLAALVKSGAFRSDLLHRLDVARIETPPLRARREDIPLLASRLLERHALALRRRVATLSQAATRHLLGYDWPGNVRELDNVLHRACILAAPRLLLEPADLLLPGMGLARTVSPERFMEAVDLPPGGLDLVAFKNQLQAQLVQQALDRAGGSQAGAATLLGIPRTSLRHRIPGRGR